MRIELKAILRPAYKPGFVPR